VSGIGERQGRHHVLAGMDSRSDAELVAAANDGDGPALEGVYVRHRDWVHGLAWRWLGDEDAAWDVCQEVFRYLMSRIPRLVLTARLRTFLWPVVRNLCAERRRRAMRETAVPAVDPAVLDRGAGTGETAEALAAVLRSLPAPQLDVVLLRLVDGFSTQEAAQALGVPPGTVKSRLHLALRRLSEEPGTKNLLIS